MLILILKITELLDISKSKKNKSNSEIGRFGINNNGKKLVKKLGKLRKLF